MLVFRVIMPHRRHEAIGTLVICFFHDHTRLRVPSAPIGKRVTSGRHYFDCDGVLLACWDSIADGDPASLDPTPVTSI
ncbi:MAG: DUF6022 family protein [Solirubrobacteraceae bacterium]